MHKYLAPVLGVMLVGWLFFIFIQPRTAEEIIAIDPLEERASSGDIMAIRELRHRYAMQHQDKLADYWLYKGALMGDAALYKEYESKYQRLSDQGKQAELQSIRTSTASDQQKDALLKKLTTIGH